MTDGHRKASKPPAKKRTAKNTTARKTAAKKSPTKKTATKKKATKKEATKKNTKTPTAKKKPAATKTSRNVASRKRPVPPTGESPDERRRRAARIVRRLIKHYPAADCALIFADGYELLVATILAAQCTDARVNTVTPTLHARFPGPAGLAAASQEEVEAVVQPTGFFREKAKNLRGMATAVIERHGGTIPRDLDALVALPGVGRKTAHVVLGTAYGIASGVVVDTHVRRISTLLGLTAETDPVRIERDLNELLPQREWIMYSHRIIHHGRSICIARRPQCRECPLLDLCPRVGLPPLDDASE